MSLFGKKTVVSILEGVYAKIEELRDHGASQHVLADDAANEALRLQGESNVLRNDAYRATKVADRIAALIEE